MFYDFFLSDGISYFPRSAASCTDVMKRCNCYLTKWIKHVRMLSKQVAQLNQLEQLIQNILPISSLYLCNIHYFDSAIKTVSCGEVHYKFVKLLIGGLKFEIVSQH